ncbi:MAG TPA: nitrate ABC transporter permease [Acidimicrobiales bacterium]|nr:nitrate ABC transporter permease [Acidimicrobiales bacterium]
MSTNTQEATDPSIVVTDEALAALVGPPPPPRERRIAKIAGAVGWALVGLAAFVAAWWFASTRSPGLPSPALAWSTLLDTLADPFYDNGPNDKGVGLQLLTSMGRVGQGFGFAVLVGVPAGLLMGASRRTWQALNPISQVLRPVSPLAWFPIWLKVSQDAPRAAVIVIFITALWPVLINTAAGAATIPQEQQDVAKVFRFGRVAYLRHVLVPNALPSIVTGLRLSMGIAWMVIVAVEMLSGSTGIGAHVWTMYNTSNMPAVVVAIIVIGAVGMLLDLAFLRLGRAVAPKGRS